MAEEHSANADPSIERTLLGIAMLVSEVHS